MIPYIAQPSFHLGPLTIHAFGVLVAIAVIVGSEIAKRRATSQGLSAELLNRLLGWVVVGGFVGGHVLDLLFYEPARVLREPIVLLKLWDGLGSFGGFVGAIAAALLFVHRNKVEKAWAYVDASAYGFPFGWIFGRLGCTVAFDHPGVATHLFFGERYTDGVVRHNLGLEEAVYTMFVAALFYVLARKKRPEGFFVAALAVVYAPVRFALDTLRIADTRYGGLTPGQIGSVVLLFIGLALFANAHRRDHVRPDAPAA
jgi:phosphatidylglycerol:prolipoprotein diacylglycerol transferase